MIIAVMYASFAAAKTGTPEKKFRLVIRTLELCDTGAALYQLS